MPRDPIHRHRVSQLGNTTGYGKHGYLLKFDWLFQLIMQHLKLDDGMVNIQQYYNKKKILSRMSLTLVWLVGVWLFSAGWTGGGTRRVCSSRNWRRQISAETRGSWLHCGRGAEGHRSSTNVVDVVGTVASVLHNHHVRCLDANNRHFNVLKS